MNARNIKKVFILAAAVAALAGCASSEMGKPIGIGTGRTDLKRSPCACIQVPQDYSVIGTART